MTDVNNYYFINYYSVKYNLVSLLQGAWLYIPLPYIATALFVGIIFKLGEGGFITLYTN